jgi:hypothetical protein
VPERLTFARASDVAPSDGHAVGQRTRDHAEQFLVTSRAAHHDDLAGVLPERPHRAQEIISQNGDLEP